MRKLLRKSFVAVILVAAMLFIAGCGGGGSDDPPPTPTVTVSASDPLATETGDVAEFTIALSVNTAEDLDITFALGGSATLTTDYSSTATTTLTIAAGTNSGTVVITPVSDSDVEGTETVTLTASDVTGYEMSTFSATVEIVEDIEITDLAMTLKSIQPGTFTMGSPDAEPYRSTTEGPQHQVTISNPFWVATTETTVDQFRAFLLDAASPSPTTSETDDSPEDTGTFALSFSIADPREGVTFSSSRCPINDDATFSLTGNVFGTTGTQPMVEISHVASTNFCIWLTERESLVGKVPAGYEYRLATEAEWEYSCRAGSTTAFSYGDDTTADGITYTDLGNHARYIVNGFNANGSRTYDVAGKLANAWGLYDMHGNIWEWCYDSNSAYTSDPQTDPTGGPQNSPSRIRRGGSWNDNGGNTRSAHRRSTTPTNTSASLGFRVVLAPILP